MRHYSSSNTLPLPVVKPATLSVPRPETRLEHVSNILSKKALISSTLSGVGTQYTGAVITGVGQVVVTAVTVKTTASRAMAR